MRFGKNSNHFYPRPPRGGRLLLGIIVCWAVMYFYPRPPRGGRRCHRPCFAAGGHYFYPRPPRGGRRIGQSPASGTRLHFYPRPPRGGRLAARAPPVTRPGFLSTSPARGTTIGVAQHVGVYRISIHVPREGDDRDAQSLLRDVLRISIHVPREGDDSFIWRRNWERSISIHVPREGDDLRTAAEFCTIRNFYPRPPRGGRRPGTS